MKKIYFLLLPILLFPIFVNYGLLSWKAPGLNDHPNPWLTFLGSYFGVLGAVSIAIININIQKEKDKKIELESYRSFVVMHTLDANLRLKNVKTHENSRIILTPEYEKMLKKDPNNEIKTTFLKLSQYGNSPVILDCKIKIELKNTRTDQDFELDINIGIIEKGIEVFCPVFHESLQPGDSLQINIMEINYKTLINENMKYVTNHNTKEEYYCFINNKKLEEIIYKQKLTSINWSYPNKTHKK